MFEQIVIRRHDNDSVIDAGAFAEALLFYDKVHLLLDAENLTALLRSVGADVLIRLLNQKRITATYLTDFLAAKTDTDNTGRATHDFGSFVIVQHADGRPYKKKHYVEGIFERTLGSSKAVRAKAASFLKHIEYGKNQEGDVNAGEGILAHARRDILDANYVQNAVRETLLEKLPDLRLPDGWYFRIVPCQNGGFRVSTDLDLATLNADPRSLGKISEAHLALSVLDARSDLDFAAKYMSEIVTTPARSGTIQLRFGQFLEKRIKSGEDISTFQDMHLNGARAIRESINSGEHTFTDFLKLLDKADKFKDWIAGLNPDAKVLNEYYQEVTRETWVDKLPGKGSRFVVCTIAGAVLEALHPGGAGAALATGVGAIDAFWIDRILKGWRPSQFVNGPLKKFVDGE